MCQPCYLHCTLDLGLKLHTLLDYYFFDFLLLLFGVLLLLLLLERFIYIYKLIKIKEKQQVSINVPKFSADAFLGGLFLTTEQGKNTVHIKILKYQVTKTRRIKKQRLRPN